MIQVNTGRVSNTMYRKPGWEEERSEVKLLTQRINKQSNDVALTHYVIYVFASRLRNITRENHLQPLTANDKNITNSHSALRNSMECDKSISSLYEVNACQENPGRHLPPLDTEVKYKKTNHKS